VAQPDLPSDASQVGYFRCRWSRYRRSGPTQVEGEGPEAEVQRARLCRMERSARMGLCFVGEKETAKLSPGTAASSPATSSPSLETSSTRLRDSGNSRPATPRATSKTTKQKPRRANFIEGSLCWHGPNAIVPNQSFGVTPANRKPFWREPVYQTLLSVKN
jgi:hypothetical protein